MKTIRSQKNRTIKTVQRVARGKQKNLFLVEGRHLLSEALRTKWPLTTVLLRKDLFPAWRESLQEQGLENKTQLLSPSLASSLSTLVSTEGIIAVAEKRAQPSPSAKPGDFFLYLDAVQDPTNVGILIRSAVAFGLNGVFAGTGSADPFRLKALYRSAGAAFHVPIWTSSCEDFLDWADRHGVLLVGGNARGTPFNDVSKPMGPFALLMGNEGVGLSEALLERCALRVAIPMTTGWDSLNVAAAGSLLMYGLK